MSDEGFWAKVTAFALELPKLSYYQVLRVDRSATPDQIRAAFYRWAPTVHPDRFARETDKARTFALSKVYSRMRESFEILSDPVKRAEYDKGLAAGQMRYQPAKAKTKAEAPTDQRAARFYQLGMQSLRAGKKAEAQVQLQMALQMEPGSELIRAALEEAGAAPAPAAPAPAAPAPQAARPAGKPDMKAWLAEQVRKRQQDRSAIRSMPRPVSSPAPRAAPGPAPRAVSRPAPRAATPPLREKVPVRKPVGDVAPIVGIDFGTTRSSISVAIGEHVFTVPDTRSRSLHPSVVHYREDGLAVCGWEAREMVYRQPKRTVSSPKRLLGRAFSDPAVAGMLHNAAYQTVAGPNDAIVIQMKGVTAAITQVCAQIVGHVRDQSEQRLGTKIDKAVFSIPVSFTETERNAVQTMARIAGIEVAGFIEEPVAAAMAYGFGKNKNEIVAVYDFGGGTFDFTVIDISGYHFKVLARGGDSWLGGDDFDQTMAKAVANALWRATNIDVHNRQVEFQRLIFACEKAKRELSLRTETQIVCDKLIEQPKAINLRQRITRPQLEQMTRELFERSLRICKRALDDVGLVPSDVHQVVASGGVSYIPFVRAGLSTFFGRPVAPAVNPDEAICLGAGFRAAQLARQPVKGVARMG